MEQGGRAGFRRLRRGGAAAALAALALGCSERGGLLPAGSPQPSAALALECRADVRARTVACAPPGTRAGETRGNILGGQNQYVRLASSAVAIDSATHVLSADVTVQNLTDRTLGSPDGSTVTGVRVFFNSGPTVTAGSGEVTVLNADGTGTFTASGQPYFAYPQLIAPGAVSAPRTWRFGVPATATEFVFTVLVQADLFPTLPLPASVRHHVSAGGVHSCSVRSEVLYCWGKATVQNSFAPLWTPRPAATALRFAEVSSAPGNPDDERLCGLTTDGKVYCLRSHTLEPVRPELTFTSVDVGLRHACAVAVDGAAYCWGDNSTGELGVPGTVGSDTAIRVATSVPMAQVTVGNLHTCAIATDGRAFCWGANFQGQLGTGTITAQSNTPVAVTGGYRFAYLSASGSGAHTCGVTSLGEAYCWGLNDHRQLGGGAADSSAVPVLVGGGHAWTRVAAGWTHSCGITSAHEALCWGSDVRGERGDGGGSGADTSMPQLAATGFTEIDAGGGAYIGWPSGDPNESSTQSHSCALADDGSTWCWGANGFGQLGNGTYTASDHPVRAYYPGELFAIALVPAGDTLAVGDTARAYGFDAIGRPAAVQTWSSSGPAVAAADADGTVRALAPGTVTLSATGGGLTATHTVTVVARSTDQVLAGLSHACRWSAGALSCWGQNGNGQVGTGGNSVSVATPTPVVGGHTFSQVSLLNETCGVGADGAAYCWGATPAPLAQPFVEVTAGSTRCGLTAAGKAFCRGAGGSGQLGNGTYASSDTMVAVAGGGTYVHLFNGLRGSMTCALTAGGDAWCWGVGPIGNGYTESSVPARVASAVPLDTLDVGYSHACARSTVGDWYCWGSNADGELGTGSVSAPAKTPVRVTQPVRFTTLKAGVGRTCGLDAAGIAYCWGNNAYGYLGTGYPQTFTHSYNPAAAQVLGGHHYVSLDLGYDFACAVRSTGAMDCWGNNDYHQLGH